MNSPGDDFDSDDYDAVEPWGADGTARWTVDPFVGLAPAASPDGESNVDHAPEHIATFRVTNPQGSVSVSTLMDGRVEQVQLSERVARMSESQLAAEILVIADLARQKAQSAQYVFILERMGQAADGDHQRSALLGEFVGKTWGLPTPEEAEAAAAEVFATRYHGDNANN
ncbi:secretion protein EspD [Mycobacterium simiae]|uniref:Secretion protein EspD n=1 Tax=Mycobacterium simiae TaxID=1784 RepID=A0A5B1BN64_MYCSI|nr:secretion protein EspD [Mycobacterium simiae]KAA1249846.1 secretion protein EspD [Mycobacterium simiae]